MRDPRLGVGPVVLLAAIVALFYAFLTVAASFMVVRHQ